MNFFNRFKTYLGKSLGGESLSGLFETNYKGLRRLEKKSPLEINEISLYLNKAIEKRAREVSKIKFKIFKQDGQEDNSSRAESYLNVLRKPNTIMAGTEFWRLYQVYRDLEGESFIKLNPKGEIFSKERGIESMDLLVPDRVKIKRDEYGEPENYLYHTGTRTLKIDADRVIRTYTPDPRSQLNAVSLIKAGIKTIENEIQLREYQNKVLVNGGKIDGVFKFNTKGGLTEEQIRDMNRKYEAHFAGAQNAGKPLFLGGDADYQRTGLTPDELSYLESLGATLDDICLLTEVPKAILSNLTDVKYSNAKESQRIFLNFTIKPLLDDLVNNLNEYLIPDDLVLGYEDVVSEDQEEKRKNLETADQISAMTTNEKRERIGLDPIEGGDEILIPMNKVPLSMGREVKKKDFNHPLRDFNKRRIYERIAIRRMDRREEIMLDKVRKYFKEQEGRILENMEGIKSYKKGLADEIFNKDREIRLGVDMFAPVLREFFEDEGDKAIERVGGQDFIVDSDAESWLNKRTETFTKEINNTTYNDLSKIVANSREAEESIKEIENKIREKYDNFSEGRAKVIARTEVHSVTNYGNFKGYKQANTPIKIWVAIMDERTRPSHARLDGEEKPMDMPFSNGLMYPGDPNGSAGETINCRCVM